MLGLSARLDLLPERQHTQLMRVKLYESQANDAYWHGLFGGLYLPHLRRAVYNAIVELEALLDTCAPRPARFIEDTDFDGADELYLQNGLIQAVLKLDGSGSVCEFDSYFLKHNFGDTLRRQFEHYYYKIQHHSENSGHSGGGIASAHERVSFKQKIDAGDMEVDKDARGLFVDRLNGQAVGYWHKALAVNGPYCHAELLSPQISKSFELVGSQLRVSYQLAEDAEGMFSTEINLAMPSSDGWGGRYIYQGRIPGGFGQPLELCDMTDITLDDDELHGSIELKVSPPASFRAQPYYSVSQSEGGFEKIMQAVTLRLEWPSTVKELLVFLEIKAKEGRT